MTTKADIHALVIDLVLGLNDTNDFISKFARLSYNIHKHGTPEAIEEAGFIDTLWGAYSAARVMSEQEFLGHLGLRVNLLATDKYAFAYTVS